MGKQDQRRRGPRWVTPFLRALERTGVARDAARDAAIDHTTAYQRRRAHPAFAQAWTAALAAYEEAKRRADEAEIAEVKAAGCRVSPSPRLREDPSTIARSGHGSPARAELREDLIAVDGQLRRAGPNRWSKRKERIFFEELAATANLRMAAEAVGVTPNAVRARRLKHPVFRAKYEAVVANAGAAVDLYLVEEMRRTFEPGELPDAGTQPRMTIDQAIKIAQLNARKQKDAPADPFVSEAEIDEAAAAELREQVLNKVERLAKRRRQEKLDQGWLLDEDHDQLIPPGWVRDPNHPRNAPDAPPAQGQPGR